MADGPPHPSGTGSRRRAWVEALPVGNGSLGAMVFGGLAREQIQFNEETVWTGHPREYQHPGAVAFLPGSEGSWPTGNRPRPRRSRCRSS